MAGITQAQLRKIWFLARERGIDEETLRAHALALTRKNSLKELTIHEAVRVIDSLAETADAPKGMATDRQRSYINGLARELGWTDAGGNIDVRRLSSFLRSRFGTELAEWLTSKTAGQVIEAMKAMTERREPCPPYEGECAAR